MNLATKHIIVLIISLHSVVFIQGQLMPEENYLKAKVFMNKEMHDSALLYLNKSLEINKENREAILDKGIVVFNKGQYKKALEEFATIEKSDKGRATIWMAKSYARLNDIDNCLVSLNLHLTSNYKLPESTILLEKDFAIFEQDPKWIKFWKEGNYYTAHDRSLAEADYMIKTKRYTEAINFLSEALTKGYRKAPLYSRRAQVYSDLNNHKLALSDLNNAITSDRRNPDLFSNRARMNYLLGNYQQSLEDYNNAIKISPSNISLYKERALSNSKTGLYDEAINDIDLYLRLFPVDDSAWYLKGIIHSDNENYMDALGCFTKSLSLNSSDPRYYSGRGLAYLNARTYKYAWRDFSMSLDLDPKNPVVYLNKGIAAINLGDKADACYCFEMAKKLGNSKANFYIEKYCK